MGNYVSCRNPIPSFKPPKTARVVFPGGEIRQYGEPTKAAELMFECPNFFLTDSKHIRVGKRFSPLAADAQLQKGSMYIMIPMKRGSSIATAADVALAFMSFHSPARRIAVRPFSDENTNGSDSGDVSVSSSSEVFQEVEDFCVREYAQRLSLCRSRKPSLETIKEEPFNIRRNGIFIFRWV